MEKRQSDNLRRSDVGKLVQLVKYRWSIPVIAELFSARGSKFVTLSRRLGVGRESLRRALSTLIDQELVERNPGYGHPMRPEYLLTPAGKAIGAASCELVTTTHSQGLDGLAFQKWSFPVVQCLSVGANRFGGIKMRLPPITSRALSLTLKDLAEASIINRSIEGAYPPISTYELTRTGTHLASLVTELSASMV